MSTTETYRIGPTNSDMLLPEPEFAPVHYTLISVDDHLVEPPGMFDGRLPSTLADGAPRLVINDRGHQVWAFDGQIFSQVGMNAVVGRRQEYRSLEPARFEDMRRGCWDVHERVKDMDLIGCWASLNFPSQVAGFAGRVFSACTDPELGLATMRAWNDWLHEEWCQQYPDRFIPCGITWLSPDPTVRRDSVPTRSDATQPGDFVPSLFRNVRTTSDFRASSRVGGIRSSRPVWRPEP